MPKVLTIKEIGEKFATTKGVFFGTLSGKNVRGRGKNIAVFGGTEDERSSYMDVQIKEAIKRGEALVTNSDDEELIKLCKASDYTIKEADAEKGVYDPLNQIGRDHAYMTYMTRLLLCSQKETEPDVKQVEEKILEEAIYSGICEGLTLQESISSLEGLTGSEFASLDELSEESFSLDVYKEAYKNVMELSDLLQKSPVPPIDGGELYSQKTAYIIRGHGPMEAMIFSFLYKELCATKTEKHGAVNIIINGIDEISTIKDIASRMENLLSVPVRTIFSFENLSELKKIYSKQELVSACDTWVYMGSKDEFTNERMARIIRSPFNFREAGRLTAQTSTVDAPLLRRLNPEHLLVFKAEDLTWELSELEKINKKRPAKKQVPQTEELDEEDIEIDDFDIAE